MSALSDRRLIARAGLALVLANVRFWPTVAPIVSAQLTRWEQRARGIEDPFLRALALEKLCEERFNSEVAATLATLAPREHRRQVIEAIVAYEVMYDYLDGLTEQPTADPLRDGHQLYQAFTDAIDLHTKPTGRYYEHQQRDDGGYLQELTGAVRDALAQLPAAAAVSEASQRAAARCATAQIRAHAVPQLGSVQLESWAASEAAAIPVGWQEFLAGAASSVLVVHALIAAAADPRTTPAEASEIDTIYLSICSLSTMLDSLIDHEQDERANQDGYLRYYDSHDDLARDLLTAARRVIEHASTLRNGARHVMTLIGVVAYYASAPSANSDFAKPVIRRLCRELRPLITATLAVMRSWRLAKQARRAITNRRTP